MFLERLLILLAIGVAGALIYGAWRWWAAARLRKLNADAIPDPVGRVLRELVGASGPAILYFTAEDCTQCRYRQTPILDGLAAGSGVAVGKVDAPSQSELTRHFGIMTVPSTVILNRELRPIAINHGLADMPRLRTQIAQVDPGARGG